MGETRSAGRDSLTNLVDMVDARRPGTTPPDTVPSGFPSLDKALGGGFRKQDLIVLGGDIGAGKSALALGIALRAANAGFAVVYLSGEMDEDRLLERALAIEGRISIDQMRAGVLTDVTRSSLGGAAVRLRELPLEILPLTGATIDGTLDAIRDEKPPLVVIDYLQLMSPSQSRNTVAEDCAASVRALKAAALTRDFVCLAIAQLPQLKADRPDRRPTLDDFGALGSVKQHADVVLGLYREEMYSAGPDVEGATELIVAKNRNGPTGFIDLYFYRQWMRFEDMLDPDR